MRVWSSARSLDSFLYFLIHHSLGSPFSKSKFRASRFPLPTSIMLEKARGLSYKLVSICKHLHLVSPPSRSKLQQLFSDQRRIYRESSRHSVVKDPSL